MAFPFLINNFNEAVTIDPTLRDYSGNGNDGTMSLTIQNSSRVGNEGLFSDFTFTNIAYGDIQDLSGQFDMGLFMALKIISPTTSHNILVKTGVFEIFYNNATTQLDVSITVASGVASVSVTTAINTYYDLHIQYRGATLFVFIDGVLIATDPSQTGVIANTANNLIIGAFGGSFSGGFALNDFKMYTAQISVPQITAQIAEQNGVLSDDGNESNFALGDIIVTDLVNSPKYAVITFKATAPDTSFRIQPLTLNITSSSSFSKVGNMFEDDRDESFIVSDNGIKFYKDVNEVGDVQNAANETLVLDNNGIRRNERSTSVNLALRDDDSVLDVDTTSGDITITMPASPAARKYYNIVKISADMNKVIINGNGNNINGTATIALLSQYDSMETRFTGTEHIIV